MIWPAQGADVVFWLGACWLVLQLTDLAPLVVWLVDVHRRHRALRRVRKRWARFRTTHPEVFQ